MRELTERERAMLLQIDGTEDIAAVLKPDAVLDLIRISKKLHAVIVQIATVAKDNHSDDKNSAAMALRFVDDLATRAVTS